MGAYPTRPTRQRISWNVQSLARPKNTTLSCASLLPFKLPALAAFRRARINRFCDQADMSGCKKRAADAAAAADATIAAFGDAKRPRTSSRPTFLFCKPNQQVVEVLSRLGRVVTFTDFKTWPNSMPNNIK